MTGCFSSLRKRMELEQTMEERRWLGLNSLLVLLWDTGSDIPGLLQVKGIHGTVFLLLSLSPEERCNLLLLYPICLAEHPRAPEGGCSQVGKTLLSEQQLRMADNWSERHHLSDWETNSTKRALNSPDRSSVGSGRSARSLEMSICPSVLGNAALTILLLAGGFGTRWFLRPLLTPAIPGFCDNETDCSA